MPPTPESQALASLFASLRADMSPTTTLPTHRALSDQTWSVGAEPKDVTYEETSLGNSPCLRIRPQNASPKHALLYLHGGGLVGCKPTRSINYRLTPENTYPAAHEDCFAAYAALLEEEGFDAKNVVLAGDSAGAGLVATTILQAKAKPAACGNVGKDVLSSLEGVRMFAGMYTAGKIDVKDASVNALYADLKGFPPAWVSVAEYDSLADDGKRFKESVEGVGGEVVLRVGEGMQHIFEFMMGKAREADESVEAIGKWVSGKIGS
ncbi:hypothetical protein PRZ48_011888 [Zasmidium cellare]|uniref:Alpha/beta hydrolase fold-3 domain-containing protein n=1 Tax=Zasmidium cellare TaxID=395010 RepID=A0ABR0E7N3_ZASCE|nr:hypothetical protein PRZ48_011888 [Zasmidium cellare]